MDLNDRENMAPYIRGARDVGDPPNLVHLLNNRQLGMTRQKFPTGLKQFAELKTSRSQLKETHCDLPASARSTFLMSFSHDCTKVASTHGDHNIYVSEMKTGKPIKTLEGHPRTPWCISFHPTSNDILASGCLAGEVRVWDLRGGGSERWRADHDQVIASLAFHPTDQLLVIATGNSLYFWNWSNPAPDGQCSTNNELERVRYVKFDPLGFRIITGIANMNNSGPHTGTCGATSTGLRTNPTCRRRVPRDVDIYRACRRTVMERLLSIPDLGDTEIPSTSNSTQEHDSSSSSSSSTSTAANQAGPSRETNTSRPSGDDIESQLPRSRRDRSPTIVGPESSENQLLTEAFCDDIARLLNGMVQQFVPYLYRCRRTATTELQQTSRTTPESEINTATSASESQQTFRSTPRDDCNTGISTSLTPAEGSQSQPSLLAQRGNLQARNNLETSADHPNSSESNMPRLQASERISAEDMMRTLQGLRGFFENFDGQLIRILIRVNEALARLTQSGGGQTNETSEPRAGPSGRDDSSDVINKETSEPRAGPSGRDDSSVVFNKETSEPRAGPSECDKSIVINKETSEPSAGPSESDRSAIVHKETSEPRAGPSQSQDNCTIFTKILRNGKTFESRVGPSESENRRRYLRRKFLRGSKTPGPRAGPSQSDGGSGIIQSNNFYAPGAGFPPNNDNQINNVAERASRTENEGDKQDNQPEPTRSRLIPRLIPSDEEIAELNRRLWRAFTQPRPRRHPEQRSTGANIPLSQISTSEHQSAEMENTLRNSPATLSNNVERPTVNESKGDINSRSSPILVQLPRHHYNRLKSEKRSNSSCLGSDKEMPESKRQKKEFDETTRGSLENSTSVAQASSSSQSPVIPNLSSVQMSIDLPSSSVAAEASSASINAEDFNNPYLSHPMLRKIMPITDEDLSLISSCLGSDKEMPECRRQKRQFDETTRGSLENSTSIAQASGSSQSPMIPNLSSVQMSIDLPSSPVTTPVHSSPVAMSFSSSSVAAETSSASINSEDFNNPYLSHPVLRNIMPITDEDFPVIRQQTNNHDMLSAEAGTQASSSSDSRNYSHRLITLEDMRDECIFSSLFTTHQCDALGGCIAIPGPSTVQIPTESYRELQVEDPSDSDIELEIPQPQDPFPSSTFTQLDNISDSDLESEIPEPQSPVPSSPVTSDVEFTSGSGSGSSRRLSSLFDPIIDPLSDASSDDSDRPSTPPLLMFSQPYNSLLFTGHSRIALNDPLTQNHRIQVWDFTAGEFPPIYDANANIVVRRCMIHNDASVDISQDGEKLVALIPPEERDLINNLMFGVFSIRPGQLGRTLCIWGYISNAISVSFSPLAQYVVVGSANSRPIYSNPEKAAVAQIIKINKSRDSYDASYIRSFTQVINNDNRLQQVSLNCVKWLPVPGLGIAYATNRGCLCICKPIAGDMFENGSHEVTPESERIGDILQRIRSFYRPRPL